MANSQTTKILLYNVGYCTGLDGSLRDYFFHSLRYLYTPKKVLRRVFTSIDFLIGREKPDLCCFVEVRRVTRFIQHLWRYSFQVFENKYGERSILRRMPFFRQNCMAFFARSELPTLFHFFRSGTKKLIYEIKINDDTSLLMSHLSLKKRTRRKQLIELKNLIAQRTNVILCGDFNIFRGLQELDDLVQSCRLKVVNTLQDVTFPALHPRKALDLFLCSEGIDIASMKVLHHHISDHLPVLLEVRL